VLTLGVWLAAVDFIYKVVQASKVNKNLQMWRQNFAEGGSWTVETRIVGRRIIFTADPENIKAILATQFSDYGKGEPFHKEWEPFLGDSIFATDGDKWHSARQLLRPQFIRDRVSDLDKFERHLQVLFRAMANGGPLNGEHQPVDLAAGNGRVLDISDLLFRYTLDVTTDFLLGQDVKSLTYVLGLSLSLSLSLSLPPSYILVYPTGLPSPPFPECEIKRTEKKGSHLSLSLPIVPAAKSSPRPSTRCSTGSRSSRDRAR